MFASQSRRAVIIAVFVIALSVLAVAFISSWNTDRPAEQSSKETATSALDYQPRKPIFNDTSGLLLVCSGMPKWDPNASLEELRDIWKNAGLKLIEYLDKRKDTDYLEPQAKINSQLMRVMAHLYEGQAPQAYAVLLEARNTIETNPDMREEWLYSVIFLQGLTALRQGEDENCVLCRGDSACILPISRSAIHTKPRGSRLAIEHFTEYLSQFPDDLGVRWLLNLAHMTLGEYPEAVNQRFLVRLEKFQNSEFNIGRFRDIGHEVGIDRLNQAGGAIMDDFDGDGLLDIVVTTSEPTQTMAFYRNKGDGTFEDPERFGSWIARPIWRIELLPSRLQQ